MTIPSFRINDSNLKVISKEEYENNRNKYILADATYVDIDKNSPIYKEIVKHVGKYYDAISLISVNDKDFATVISSGVGVNPITGEYSDPSKILTKSAYITDPKDQLIFKPESTEFYIGFELNNIYPIKLELFAIDIQTRLPLDCDVVDGEMVRNTDGNPLHNKGVPIPVRIQIFGRDKDTSEDWEVVTSAIEINQDTYNYLKPIHVSILDHLITDVKYPSYKLVIWEWDTSYAPPQDEYLGLGNVRFQFGPIVVKGDFDAICVYPKRLKSDQTVADGQVSVLDLSDLYESDEKGQMDIVALEEITHSSTDSSDSINNIVQDIIELKHQVLTLERNQSSTLTKLEDVYNSINNDISKLAHKVSNVVIPIVPVAKVDNTGLENKLLELKDSLYGKISKIQEELDMIMNKITAEEYIASVTTDATEDYPDDEVEFTAEVDTCMEDAIVLTDDATINNLHTVEHSVVSDKDIVQLVLPPDPAVGNYITITSYKLSGKVVVRGNGSLITVVYNNTLYSDNADISLTSFGEKMSVVYSGEKWLGRVESGVKN